MDSNSIREKFQTFFFLISKRAVSIIYNSREPLRLANKYDLVNDEKSFHLALCPVKELPTLGGLECVWWN